MLIGDLTYRLVRDAVTVEAVEPLELKGKAERVAAYRLIEVSEGDGLARRQDIPLVGREAELGSLLEVVELAKAASRCHAATIIGDPGVGKSRLFAELVERLGDSVTVVRGRCLSYGDGITFWPLAEIAHDAAGIGPEDPPEVGEEKLRVLIGDADAASRVSAAIGLSTSPFAVDELFWGARVMLEALAAERPVIALIDDIHWAEPTFLALLDHVTDHAAGPVVLVCTARHEVLDKQPDWATGERRVRIDLDRLDEASVAALLASLVGDAPVPPEVLSRVVEAADGNPLFVEQIVSMFEEQGLLGSGEVPVRGFDVPPTVQALVAGRLDLLDRSERAVIEPASVVGMQFATDAVVSLAPPEVTPEIGAHLASIVRKHLVRRSADDAEGEDHRFHHVLIREAAYQGLLKRARAELHERFVAWADARNSERERAGEYEEISAYHLEQSYRYLAELGPIDDHGRELGRRAHTRLTSAGHRAFARGDMPAALSLLRRATQVVDADAPERLAVAPDLAEALMETGAFAEALAHLDDAASAAARAGSPITAGHLALVRLLVERYSGDEPSWADRAGDTARRLMETFVEAGDLSGQVKCGRVLAWVHGQSGEYDAAAAAAETVMARSRDLGDSRQEARGAIAYAMAALYGHTPVGEAIARCTDIARSVEADRRTQSHVLSRLAELLARDGSFEDARAAYRRSKAQLLELGSDFHAATIALNSWRVELLAGDLDAAESELRDAHRILEEMGEHYHLSTVAAALARVRFEQGALEEAEHFAEQAAGLASEDDVVSQTLWRGVRARVRAATDDLEAAERFGREAVELIGATQDVLLQSEALADLADVLVAAGRRGEAREALERARSIATAKGDRVVAAALDETLRAG